LTDDEIFSSAVREQRAILTEAWGEFRRLLDEAAADGTAHFGVVFTSRKPLPRSGQTIGEYVRVLDELLAAHPAEDALLNGYRWLP
jgi:hypothetical protein